MISTLPSSQEIEQLFNELNNALVQQVLISDGWDLKTIRQATNTARSMFEDEFAAARRREGMNVSSLVALY